VSKIINICVAAACRPEMHVQLGFSPRYFRDVALVCLCHGYAYAWDLESILSQQTANVTVTLPVGYNVGYRVKCY